MFVSTVDHPLSHTVPQLWLTQTSTLPCWSVLPASLSLPLWQITVNIEKKCKLCQQGCFKSYAVLPKLGSIPPLLSPSYIHFWPHTTHKCNTSPFKVQRSFLSLPLSLSLSECIGEEFSQNYTVHKQLANRNNAERSCSC